MSRETPAGFHGRKGRGKRAHTNGSAGEKESQRILLVSWPRGTVEAVGEKESLTSSASLDTKLRSSLNLSGGGAGASEASDGSELERRVAAEALDVGLSASGGSEGRGVARQQASGCGRDVGE